MVRTGAALLLLGLLGWGAPCAVASQAATHPLGRFVDDYGEHYEISASVWTQLPHGRYLVQKVDPAHHFLIARNDSANRYDPGKWTRIDFVPLREMKPWSWAFCLSAYDAPSAAAAEGTTIARVDSLRSGCNGHPFTRLRPEPPDRDALLERCHQLYLAAGSDGPKLLAVDAVIVDSTADPPLRCGPLRSAHPRLKSSE